MQPDWGFAWPHNRRIMYNRASADPEGKPWSERKKYIWWDEAEERWTGLDEPDFEPDKPPDYRPPQDAKGMDAIGGDRAVHHEARRPRLAVRAGRVKDGPVPGALRAGRIAGANLLYPASSEQPDGAHFRGPAQPDRPHAGADYPIVACTFRLTEHYLSGPMSRFNSWLNELQPEMFVELSPELAEEQGIENGGWLTILAARQIEARAMVTRRIKPLHDRRAPRPSDRHAVPLGLRRRVGRQQSPTT